MALQDLTPQLRTRLGRVERAVGWFVLLAAALLAAGFAYYLINTAARKGWFIQTVNYQTSLASATGLEAGDPVMLMGFNVGEITRIEANAPGDYFGVTICFRVRKPYYGYVWTDSTVRVAAADFLGGRVLELTKGVSGVPTVAEDAEKRAIGLLRRKHIEQRLAALTAEGRNRDEALAQLNAEARADTASFYEQIETSAPYWVTPAESPALTERLDRIIQQAEMALPGILQLTNDLARVLSEAAGAMSNLNLMTAEARPAAANLADLSAQLRGEGALGEWLLAPQDRAQLSVVLTNTGTLLAGADTNLNRLVEELAKSLENLAGITSNLNAQVQANTNILSSVSDAIVHADELIQGLKRHWLLRSAFRAPATNAEPAPAPGLLRAPNDPFH